MYFQNIPGKSRKYFKKPSKKITQKKNKAILLGLNYPGTRFRLSGCVNDVRNGQRYLKKHNYDTKLLIDRNVSKNYNVLEALEELAKSDADKVFFHYSGHGTRKRDQNGDEADGWDEVVFSKDGVEISDDDICKVVQSIKGKTVFLIFDCCHSGSIVDLPFQLNPNGSVDKVNSKKFNSDIICISGCKDHQTSADITEGNVSYGALSKTLYDLLRKNRCKTWKNLWNTLTNEMRKKGYSQIPQISASDSHLFNRFIKF